METPHCLRNHPPPLFLEWQRDCYISLAEPKKFKAGQIQSAVTQDIKGSSRQPFSASVATPFSWLESEDYKVSIDLPGPVLVKPASVQSLLLGISIPKWCGNNCIFFSAFASNWAFKGTMRVEPKYSVWCMREASFPSRHRAKIKGESCLYFTTERGAGLKWVIATCLLAMKALVSLLMQQIKLFPAEPPPTPGNLSILEIASRSVKVSWTIESASPRVERIAVQWKEQKGKWQL